MLELIVAFLALVADQLSKLWVVESMGDQIITIIPGVIQFRYVENTGMAFGLLGDSTLLLTIITAVIVVILPFVMWKFRKTESKFFRITLALILGGAIGNLIDRIALGYVVDFIEPTFMNFAVFNVADCFVVVGAILLAVYLLFFQDKYKKARKAAQEAKPAAEEEAKDENDAT